MPQFPIFLHLKCRLFVGTATVFEFIATKRKGFRVYKKMYKAMILSRNVKWPRLNGCCWGGGETDGPMAVF